MASHPIGIIRAVRLKVDVINSDPTRDLWMSVKPFANLHLAWHISLQLRAQIPGAVDARF
jgi:hypothetical protein